MTKLASQPTTPPMINVTIQFIGHLHLNMQPIERSLPYGLNVSLASC
jgi:hypothetical protein